MEAAVDHGATIALLGAILLALVGVIGALVKMWPAIMGAQYHASEANKAVNNRGGGEHALYDIASSVRDDVQYLVAKQREFDAAGWGALPDDIGDAPALTETIRAMQANDQIVNDALSDLRSILSVVDEKVDVLGAEVSRHIEWEEAADGKYRQS